MTVAELISRLKTLPPTADVLIDAEFVALLADLRGPVRYIDGVEPFNTLREVNDPLARLGVVLS